MAFDKYNGDQVIGFTYNEDNSTREVGFNIWDRPDGTAEEQKRNYEAAHNLRPGPERDALMQQAVGAQRVYIGRLRDKAATLTLFDTNSRPRLRMLVGATGEARLEFLNANGKLIESLPAGSR